MKISQRPADRLPSALVQLVHGKRQKGPKGPRSETVRGFTSSNPSEMEGFCALTKAAKAQAKAPSTRIGPPPRGPWETHLRMHKQAFWWIAKSDDLRTLLCKYCPCTVDASRRFQSSIGLAQPLQQIRFDLSAPLDFLYETCDLLSKLTSHKPVLVFWSYWRNPSDLIIDFHGVKATRPTHSNASKAAKPCARQQLRCDEFHLLGWACGPSRSAQISDDYFLLVAPRLDCQIAASTKTPLVLWRQL